MRPVRLLESRSEKGWRPVAPVARPPRGPSRSRAGAGSWQWARTAQTQRALLDAARAVFTGQGFADASEAVARARKAGVTDPFELFSAGARAFMEGCWQRRDLAVLFSDGDGPPGFEVMKRRRGREWLGQNDPLLRLSDTPFDRLYVTILTTLIGEGSREVAAARSRRQAGRVIDAVTEYVRLLMTGGAWWPAARGGRPEGVDSGGDGEF